MEVRHAVRAISIPQKSDETAIMLIPPHDFPRIEERKERRWNGTTSGVEAEGGRSGGGQKNLLLSLHPESPFIEEEETTARPETWSRESTRRVIGAAPMVNRGSRRARARAKKRAVATTDDAAADADNNNAWETAECEKNEQGGIAEAIKVSQ